MTERLPRVKSEIFDSVASQCKNGGEIEKWMQKLFDENPNVVIAVDGMGTAGGLLIAALVYKLLDSQAEANEMNEGLQ